MSEPSMKTPLQKLIALYERMSALTYDKCNKRCKTSSKTRCCDEFHCNFTKDYALETYNINLEPLTDGILPFLDKNNRCVVAPYLRPLCTINDCQIGSLGFDPTDEDYTQIYFKLREEISALSFEIEDNKNNS